MADLVALKPRYIHEAGRAVTDKSGRAMGGKYPKTEATFELHDKVLSGSSLLVSDQIGRALETIPQSLIDRIQSEGQISFIVGVFSDSNVQVNVDRKTICQLAAKNVDLKFDFYGGPD